MHLMRKLFLLAMMALAALALTAGTASAQLEIHAEEQSSVTECGEDSITLVEHVVNGGCHVEFESTHNGIPLHAYVPGKVTISNCEVFLEGQIDEHGEGYITEALLTTPDAGAVPCTRRPCDEDSGATDTMIPWPFHIRELGAGHEEAEAVFCLRPVTNPEGSAGTQCEIHLELNDLGNHNYELGDEDLDGTPSEEFCENNPPNGTTHPTLPFPVSIEPHLVTTGTERVEIIH